MRDHDLPDVHALRSLDPPPGGQARLRAALDAEAGRDTRWRWAIAAAAVAAIVLVVLALATRPEAPAPAFVIAPAPAVPVLVADPAVASSVQFYWVSSRPAVASTTTASIEPTDPPMVTFRDR